MLNSPEFKVGAMVVTVATIIGMMSMKVAEGPGIFGGTKKYWFTLQDANGLVENSAVKIAGISVGVIEKIKLKNGQAEVHLLVAGDVPITTSSLVEVRSDGILGDKHIEINPGNPVDPKLESGSEIKGIAQVGSLNDLVSEVGKITGSLSELADTLNAAVKGTDTDKTALGRIVKNIENLTGDLAEVTGKNKQKLNEIVDQVHSITESLDGFISDDSENGFAAGWQNAIDSLSRIDRSLKNVEEITAKINDGEGTIGRLVNDEETVEGINEAIYNVNEFLGGASSMETSVDFHTEYLSNSDVYKSYLTLKIQPGLDRYYEISVVDDPFGLEDAKTITQTTGPTTTVTEKSTVFKNKVKFNALFAKNFYNFTVKGGIMENTGGFGFDYFLFRNRLKMSLEIFDFEDLHVRAFARYNVLKGVYIVAGGDDIADEDRVNAFFGAGVFITNDDLKLLASKVSF